MRQARALGALVVRAMVLGLFGAAPALAVPPDAPWTGSGSAISGPAMTTSVVSDGTSSAAVFEYDNNAPDTGGGGAQGNWQFQTTASESGPVTLSYHYDGFHAFFQVRVTLNAFVQGEEIRTTTPIRNEGPTDCCTTPSNGFVYTGEVTLYVNEGDTYGFEMTGSNFDYNSRLSGTLTVDGSEPAGNPGETVLMQVVPAGPQTVLSAQVTGPADATRTLELLTSASCIDGQLGGEPEVFGQIEVDLDSNGEAFVDRSQITNTQPLATFVSGRVLDGENPGALSPCVVAGPDNDSWTRALSVPLTGTEPKTGSAQGRLDSAGNARWYRFAISPGAKATITLSGLPADYDLAVFKDIAKTFAEDTAEQDPDLNKLSAEFAPSVFSPSVFSPSVFSPSVFSPDAYAPSVFSPSVFSPSVFSPSVFSPSVFSPSVFSPSVFSPSVFSPSVFSPSVFSPSVFSPSVFSPSVFSPDSFASAQTRSLIAVSAQPGTGTEQVAADTWSNTGEFYVRVSGKNGAFDVEDPFQLSIELDGTICDGVEALDPPFQYNAPSGQYRSIILWDEVQFESAPGYTPAQKDALVARMNSLAARPEVQGVVVNLADIAFADIQALHAQADEASSCPYAENLTAQAIKEVIDAYRRSNPELAYVVLMGSDGVIPFFRYPDQGLLGPEQDYEPPMADGTQSQASLRLNYVLGQDEYGASTSLSLRDGQFPVPDLAVGRLVESPAEMITLLDAYLATSNGVVPTPTSTLVSGYDFLTDAADAVQAELVAGTVGARNDRLVTAADISPADPRSWTATDLRRELLNTGEDIIFLAGHFSANSTLAADYKTTMLVTDLTASTVDLNNALVFSAGCHSGYNIVDGDAVPNVTLRTDWAQAFAQKGATLVAGTGYQYGDTDFIEYSERLYVEFARALRTGSGPVSVGQALVRAKQRYLETTPDVRGLHRKSVLISTVFGLPMLSVNLPGQRIPDGSGGSIVNLAEFTTGPGAELDLSYGDVFLDSADFSGITEETRYLKTDFQAPENPADPNAGKLEITFLNGPDGIVTHPGEPALPLVTKNVSASKPLRGVGFRGGYWTEQTVVPLTGAPTTELRGVHTPFASLVNFPMRLATPNYYGALRGNLTPKTLLHVTPAQHRVASIGDFDATLREFQDLEFRLFYSDNTQSFGGNQPYLAAPPTMSGISAVVDGSDVRFAVKVVGAPAAGIQAVWVTHTDGSGNSGEWRSVDLGQSPTDSKLWTGVLPGGANTTQLDFVVHAVNGVGLVTTDDNFGGYYQVAGTGPAQPAVSELELDGQSGPLPTSGAYGSKLQLEASLTPAQNNMSVLFTLGATAVAARTDHMGIARSDLNLNATPGTYKLRASFAGNAQYAPSFDEHNFTVTKANSTLTLATGVQSVDVEGVESGVTAKLTSPNGTPNPSPLLERTVYFTVTGGPNGPVKVPAITNNVGVARLGTLALPAGNYTVKAQFPASSLYNGSTSASVGLTLQGSPGCPTASVKGKLNMVGFCYLRRPVDGKITITNGTLIVGSGAVVHEDGTVVGGVNYVDQKIDQVGAGSVIIDATASVRGGITEAGPGSIVVSGSVGGNLVESGQGDILISSGAEVDGNVTEADGGSLIVEGTVDGHVTETGAGDLVITGTGMVDGNATESGPGSLSNDGSVSKDVTQD